MKQLLCAAALLLAASLGAQSPCSPLSTPDLPPWPIDNALQPWRIQTTQDGNAISGNAYLKYNCNPTSDSLTKPFIFVEGVDFNLAETALKLGDFGWPSFIGSDPDFPMLSNASEMLQLLREAGYDIILLDFSDGARSITENAALLVSLIEKVKQHTANKEPLVLAGASMGGQITRYALSWMEQQGLTHCCRLWISLDSPHTGANIPPGIQHSLEFLADASLDNAEAQDKFASTLLRPAARQMLRYHVPGVNSLYEDYYAEINALGYPQKPRTIGIANGAMDGTTLPIAPGSYLYEYDVSVPVLDLNVASLRAFAAPGNSGLLFHGFVPSEYQALIDGTCTLFPTEWLQDDVDYPTGMIPLDHAPGGTRNTISEFVLEVNDNLINAPCPADTIELFQSMHSFIPTASALGMDDEHIFAPIGQILAENSSLSPFDYTHGPLGLNEPHSAISPQTAALIITQTLAGENPLGPLLDNTQPNGGLFNFRDSATFMVHDLEILNNGQLRVNADLPPHFGQASSGALTPPGGHFELQTNPCGAHIWVHTNGTLRLGQGSVGSTAELRIAAESQLVISPTGMVQIDAGSRIVVERGGRLVLDGGDLLGLNGASIVVEDGGVLEYRSGKLRLYGPNGGLHMHGKFIQTADADFTWGGLNETTAALHWYASASLEVQNDMMWRFLSDDPFTVALHIHPHGNLAIPDFVSSVWLKQCGVLFDEHGKVFCDAPVNMNNVALSSPNQDADGWEVSRHTFCYQTFWTDVPLVASMNDGLLEIQDSEMTGSHANVFVKGRTYDIANTDFTGSRGISSEGLEFDARLQSCTFNTNGVAGVAGAVHDFSPTDLFVQECVFEACNTGLSKARGTLYVQCSTFSENDQGIACSEGCIANLSSAEGGGFNTFDHNLVAMHFLDAGQPVLKDGYNQFNQENHLRLAQGSIAGSCFSGCDPVLNATHNSWTGTADIALPSTTIPGPLPEKFELWTLDTAASCTPDPNYTAGCWTAVLDQGPVDPVACGEGPKFGLNRLVLLGSEVLSIHPNPALGRGRLCNAGAVHVYVVDIVDANGTVLLAVKAQIEGGGCLDLPDLPIGVYAVRIKMQDGMYVMRYTCL